MTPDSNLEDVLFDHENILNLKNGENVKNMPMMSLKYNKLVYLTQNLTNLQAFNIKCVPFLHDRQIIISSDKNFNGYETTIDESGYF